MTWVKTRSILSVASALALLLVLGSPAFAASTSYNDSVSFPLSPGSDTAVIPQWDPALFPGQVLVSVELEIDATVGADITAENDSAIGGNISVSLTGLVGATAPSGLSATAGIIGGAGPVPVAASDGNPGSGPDFHDFGTISDSDSDNDTIFAVLGPYIGNGNLNIPVNGSGGFAVSGVTDSTLQISNFAGSGVVTVTYTYEPVPEPSTIALALLGACGAALALWRRRK
jgi:hypothetical protein